MSKTIFITGATGFVGSKLAEYYLNKNYRIVSILHDENPKAPSKILNVHDDIIWCRGDMRDTNLVRRILSDYEVEEVIHTAAMPVVRVGYRTTTPILDNNIMGTISVLDAVNEQHTFGLPIKMIHMSSDKAYGSLGRVTPHEDYRFNPNDIYSVSKSASDLIAQVYIKLYELPLIIVRPCNIYGFYDSNPRVIPNTILSCLQGSNPKIFEGIESVREFIFNEDLCELYNKLLNTKEALGESFNVGTGEIYSQEEIVKKILTFFPDLNPIYTKPPEYTKGELLYEKLDCKKLYNLINWKPKYNFDTGLEITIEKYREFYERSIRE